MSVLDAKHFHDEAAAYRFVEAHVWPEGRVCPHCGVVGNSGKLKGKSTRVGVHKCYACRKPFRVTVGTIFESSHIKLHVWLQAIFLLSSSKKGISSNQLARTLGVTLKTAWFLSHRVREAMRDTGAAGLLGGENRVIEADETYMGPKDWQFVSGKGWRGRQGTGGKVKVLTLVERGGRARSIKADHLTAVDVRKFVLQNASTKSELHTDEAMHYRHLGKEFAKHQRINHGNEEYARGPVTTNNVEGFFSVFKRGMRGVYQHCGEQHLQRYLNEFDFRFSNRASLEVDDVERARRALIGIVGKRLTYETTRA